MAREPILNKLPPKLAFAFVAVAFYLSVVLLLIALPLKALYGLLLRPVVWIEWDRRGKDTLVVDFDSARSKAWMERIRPVIGDRAVFLNYSLRKNWKWNSLETQLYEVFGPHGDARALHNRLATRRYSIQETSSPEGVYLRRTE